MPGISIEKELCKGCGYCILYCPQKIIEMGKNTNSKGYTHVFQTDGNRCTGCKICAIVCPDAAIEVYK